MLPVLSLSDAELDRLTQPLATTAAPLVVNDALLSELLRPWQGSDAQAPELSRSSSAQDINAPWPGLTGRTGAAVRCERREPDP